MEKPEKQNEALTRLVEDDRKAGPAEALATFVQAAADERPRLHPHAVDRIETRLQSLDARGRVWRGLRVPAYVLATALCVVVIGSRFSSGAWLSPAAPIAAVPTPIVHVASAPSVEVHTLQLDTGSIEVHTDEAPAFVETPHGRVEIAPSSAVKVTVEEHDVRIAASSGSAKIIYSDGRTELALPAVSVTGSKTMKRASRIKTITDDPAPTSTAPIAIAPVAPVGPAGNYDGEHASFGTAIARIASSPSDALGLLDAHIAHYPDGVTRPEAERARIAVLLRLSRKSDALATLDRLRSPSLELLVMRGELRTDARRFDEAAGDFGAVLVADDDRFAERALFGRAMCRQRAGERQRMTADLERYLLLYPRGEFSDKARAELRHASDR